MKSNENKNGSEQKFRCYECGNVAVVQSENDDLDVLLGCSSDHDVKTMIEITEEEVNSNV